MHIALDQVAAVVFDLGRVLIDIRPERSLEHWSRHGQVPVAQLRERFVHDHRYEQFERGEIDFRSYAAHLRATLGLELDDATLESGWNALLGGALPGADRAIAVATARFPGFVFSNSNTAHESVWQREHAQLLAPLRECFVSSSIGRRKPEPNAYRDVAARIGVEPTQILFFDDLAENVAAAVSVGYQAVQVSGPHDILDIFPE